MSDRVYTERKIEYSQRMRRLIDDYKSIVLVKCDFVGSHQLQQIRQALRGRAELLMGKNTMMRRILYEASNEKPELESLIEYVVNNVGLVFTNDNVKEIRTICESFRVPAAAKPGVIAQCDVWVPAGTTGCDPGQTSFFQALNIATKINRGAIEIISNVHLIKEGAKVGAGEVALLAKLDIRPFSFGLKVATVYDNGSIYDAKVLDLSEEMMLSKFGAAVSRIAAIGLQIGYPTIASLPHSIGNAFKKIIAISLATEYTFEQSQKFKDYLANPGAFAAPAAASAAAPAAAEPEEEEEEEEEEEDMGFDLFD